MILQNPTKNCHKELPNDVWVTIASFLPPPQMKRLEVVLVLPGDSIANQASELLLRGLREIANNFWEESAAIYGTRIDENLSILEQLVAKDPSPLANQLRVGRESLRILSEDLPCTKGLFNDESWNGVHTFLFRFLVLTLYDIDRKTVSNGINVFCYRKDLLALAIWMIFGVPSLPITIMNYQDSLRLIKVKFEEFCYIKVEELKAKRYFSKARINDINTRLGRVLCYDDPESIIGVDSATEVFKYALGSTPVPGNRVDVGLYLAKYENLEGCIGSLLEDCRARDGPYPYDDYGLCIFRYFYLLVIYLYGSFHPVTVEFEEYLQALIGETPLPEIYAFVVNWLEHGCRKNYGMRASLENSWRLESDGISDSASYSSICIYLKYNGASDNYRTYSPGSADIQIQRRCLYISVDEECINYSDDDDYSDDEDH